MAVVPSKAITSATTSIFISVALPATYDEAGFEALTWIELGEVSNIGQIGGVTTIVNHIPVNTATVVKRAGSVNYGQMALDIATHTGTDSTALQTAFTSRLPVAFKIEYPASLGQLSYFSGIVASNPTTVATADSILMSNVSVEIDNEVLTVAA